MFASPNISKAQPSRFSVSDLSAHSHLNPSLLSTQPFSLIQSPQVNQSLFDFRFSNSSRHTHQHSSPGKELCVDRFIPVRTDPVKKKLLFDMQQDPRSVIDEEGFSNRSQQNASYRIMLEEQILGLSHSMDSDECLDGSLGHGKSSNRLLNFKSHREDRLPISDHIQQSCLPFDYEARGAKAHNNTRRIPDKPCRVLEAPYLEDDYYLNLLDWSESNIVAVALRDTIYLWYGTDGVISRLSQMDSYSDIYTSVGWNSTGDLLATGISNGRIEIWDPFRMKVVRDDLEDHYGRVSCLGWNSNNILASGSMDNNIILRDMRIRGPQSTVMRLKGHKYEVCGLKWSPNNFQLATGGNDNKLFIWNIRKGVPEAKFGDHKAAVKALTWSPHQNGLLLSGGGNNDKTIKFWNTLTMKNVKSVYTASQVCNLLFSKNSNEFVSTHGFNNNHVVIWKYPELSKVSVLEGHTSRVLYLALSPDGETIVTGAGAADETLRFWTAFPPVPQCVSSKLMPNSTNLR